MSSRPAPRPLAAPGWGKLRVHYRPPREGAPPLPLALLPAYELILDSSGSMKEKMGDKEKIDVARDVAQQVVRSLPDAAAVGLRLYGHWGIWLPRREVPDAQPLAIDDARLDKDSELVVPIGLLTRQRRAELDRWITWAQPRGKTPMVYSLLEARNDFPAAWRGPRTVVLVSDGMETCGGKLEDVEAAYRGAGLDVVIHVVGFDIQETAAETQLKGIAAAGGGSYFPAADAKQLAAALKSAVGSTAYVVYAEDGETLVDRGLINGPGLELPPGKYVAALPLAGGGRVDVEIGPQLEAKIRVTDGAELEAEDR